MDGNLMSKLHGNLNLISDESFKILLKYYKTGSLTCQEENKLLREIIKGMDTLKVQPSPSLKTSTPIHETT